MNWADTPVGYDIRGGAVRLQQYQTRLMVGTFAEVAGGSLGLVGARFTKALDAHIAVTPPGAARIAATSVFGPLRLVGPVDTAYQP
jgi:hypothetical protein